MKIAKSRLWRIRLHETKGRRSKIFSIKVKRQPRSAFSFGNGTRCIGPREDVYHQVAGICQKANEKLRQFRGKASRMTDDTQ